MTITRNPDVGEGDTAASPVPPPEARELSRRGFLGTALAGGLSAAIAPPSTQLAVTGALPDEQAQRDKAPCGRCWRLAIFIKSHRPRSLMPMLWVVG